MFSTTKKTAALALMLALVLAMSLAASAQAVPPKFWGVVPQSTLGSEQFQRLGKGGVESLRIPVGWADLQPQEGGQINWGGVDEVVEQAARAGIDVLPTITGAPTWAVPTALDPGAGD